VASTIDRCPHRRVDREDIVNGETEREAQVEGTTLEGDVGDVSAEAVTIALGTARTVEARTATVEQGAVFEVKADSVQVDQSAIGKIEGASVQSDQCSVGLVKAEAVTLSDGAMLGAYAEVAHLERSNVAFLAAKHVDGEARILVDWRAAAAFGAAVGLVLGLVQIVLGRGRD
jgi:hypothetical protein